KIRGPPRLRQVQPQMRRYPVGIEVEPSEDVGREHLAYGQLASLCVEQRLRSTVLNPAGSNQRRQWWCHPARARMAVAAAATISRGGIMKPTRRPGAKVFEVPVM